VDLFPRPARADPWYNYGIDWGERGCGYVEAIISKIGREGDRYVGCGELLRASFIDSEKKGLETTWVKEGKLAS